MASCLFELNEKQLAMQVFVVWSSFSSILKFQPNADWLIDWSIEYSKYWSWMNLIVTLCLVMQNVCWTRESKTTHFELSSDCCWSIKVPSNFFHFHCLSKFPFILISIVIRAEDHEVRVQLAQIAQMPGGAELFRQELSAARSAAVMAFIAQVVKEQGGLLNLNCQPV